MSTSEAGALGGVAAGEPRPPPDGSDAAARTERERHDERLGGNFLRENRHFSQIPNGHPWHPSAIRREDTHKAGLLAAPPLRQPEAACCSQSQLPAQPVRSRFTSSLFFRLGCNLKDPCLNSSTVTSRADTDGVLCQLQHGNRS
eukprot:XP_011606048.1 PREDICTED: uncharacterized protein LOC105416975 isoform X4 [Takifugu rubripes]